MGKMDSMDTAAVTVQVRPAGKPPRSYTVVMDGPRVAAVLIPHGLSDLQHAVATAHLGDRNRVVRDGTGEKELARMWGCAEVVAWVWWVDTMISLSTAGALPRPRGITISFAS